MGLLDRMLKIVPPSLTRLFFANSGSEAVDNAIKVARAHTKRQNIICFEVSAHPSCTMSPQSYLARDGHTLARSTASVQVPHGRTMCMMVPTTLNTHPCLLRWRMVLPVQEEGV